MTTLAAVLSLLEGGFKKVTIEIDGREHKVDFLDESGLGSSNDSFFLAGEEFGPCVLIHARSFEDAREAWIDERPTISQDELIEAYGIVDDDALRERYEAGHGESPPWGSAGWDAWHDGLCLAQSWYLANWETENPGKEFPELIEGYEYQSNATGTGIVDVGHYSWMNEVDPSEIGFVGTEQEES